MKTNKILSGVISGAMILGTMSIPVFAADTEGVEYNGTIYTSFTEAREAVGAESNEITYTIHGEVVFPEGAITDIVGAATNAETVNFKAAEGDTTAEIAINGSGVNIIGIDMTGAVKTINYNGLILSRANGSWVGDLGHANNYFTTAMRGVQDGIVNYTSCTFPNGSCNNFYGKTIYTDCDFNNDTEYGLWIYGGETEVTGATFTGAKGVQAYSEDVNADVTTKITDSTFEGITKKPAIISGTKGTVTLENITTTNCAYGLLQTKPKDGNASLPCAAVTIDGEEPVYVAKVGSSVYTDQTFAAIEAEEKGTTAAPVVAKVGNTFCSSIQEAVDAASEGDTIIVKPGTFDEAITIPSTLKNVTIEGSLDEAGNIATKITKAMVNRGENITIRNIECYAPSADKVIDDSFAKATTFENILIDGGNKGIHLSPNSKVFDSTINNCFMAVYFEGNGNITLDGLKERGVTYGMQIVPYGVDNVITVTNCDIDCTWANSIGSYGDGKKAKLIAENNIFRATDPYYGADSKAYGINTFLPNSKITNNVFDEKSAILVREAAGADNGENLDLTKNYFAAGPAESLENETKNVTVSNVFPVYVDAAKTTLSNVNIVDSASVGNLSVSVQNMNEIVPVSDLTNNSEYAVKAVSITPSEPVSVGDNEQVSYVDISFTKDGETINPSLLMNIFITMNEPVSSASVKHWNGSAWENVSATLIGNILSFNFSDFSPFAVVYSSTPVTDPATEIAVELEKVTDTEYNIVLKSDKTINRFMSAELAFEYVPTEGAVSYEIKGVGNVNVIDPETSGKDAYEFNMNGTEADITGTRITIGKVLFTGYGKGSFNTKGSDINFVNTSEISDNIVTHYVVGGGTDVGLLILPAPATDNIEISVPRQSLTVNVKFNNPIENEADNDVDYQSMMITISGGDLAGKKEIKLGSDNADVTFDSATNTYTTTVSDLLTQNVSYMVTVSGEGYRTTRYNVTMTSNKTLNFWNNVMDSDVNVEEYNAASAKKVTFLAGDIVKDNNINIYDLSAVVSYFGKTELKTATDYDKFVKYDLNRDGKIDSKDVAYVLVSWNK
ncbi:MAG: dockerin type I domain-containing protein [Clostridia bacterium]|nr:dockerin type I domain-containing protein [Clostridia bacterium]